MLQFYTIERPGPGRLSTMGRPPGDVWLQEHMVRLVEAGVTSIVSMLMPEEAARLGLAEEDNLAVDCGLEFLSVPIPDLAVPSDDLSEPSAWIRAHLSRGGHVLVHCRAGVGRSSLMAAAVLVDEGFDPEAAWAALSRARGMAVPDTGGQRRWLAARASSTAD